MISVNNQPLNRSAIYEDFTIEAYRSLVRLGLSSYTPASYGSIPWGKRFVLWRHDCDCSLQRALALGRIEQAEGLKSTFFVNPHSEFYNLLEGSQILILRQLVQLGHELALHFDGSFYGKTSEDDLNQQVRREADFLEQYLGICPAAFSFHNPSAFHLSCEADSYGGLINCYSKRFKTDVPYCSDSNGYWRFRQLSDVLNEGRDPCLQVLTHPEWWQTRIMSPRQRIFRSVYGRARATMRIYDQSLEDSGRENFPGATGALRFLRKIDLGTFEILDYLWNMRRFQPLFLDLWRLHESQTSRICKAVLLREWKVPPEEINAYFESGGLAVDAWRLFAGIFDHPCKAVLGCEADAYPGWMSLRNQLVNGRAISPKDLLEEGCGYLCGIIESLAAWGRVQPIGYDGLAHLGTIGIRTCKTADGTMTDRLDEVAPQVPGFPAKRWAQFKAELEKDCAPRVET